MFMEVSRKKRNSANAPAGELRSRRWAFHKIVYRVAFAAAVFTCLVSVTAVSEAQEDRPQIMPGERKPSRKKDVGPRALALLRLTADGKASLVPIAILINGKFWDASAYKAAPIPMALESGTVYEAEQSGSSMGLFTVGAALHSNAANAPTPWIGTGSWLPAGAQAANKPLKAESAPVGIDSGDQPPRLTRNPSNETPPASTAPAAAPAPTPGPSSGDEPPRLTKPAPVEAPPASTAPASTPTSTPPQGDSKGPAGPSQSGTAQPGSSAPPTEAKPSDRAKAPESDSGAGEADRPRLRRGKPAEPLPDEEVPGYSKPGAAPSANAGKAATVAAVATAGPVQLIPAISDARGPEPRSFSFEWLKDEEAERRQQMMDFAKQQLRSYLDAQAKTRITPAPSGTQTTRHKQASKPAEPVLENVRMFAYDLWTNNQPVMIFSAQAHMPPPPEGSQGGIEADLQYSILLVAYPDIYNNLHKLYAGVTDKYHLDVTPRLELIDAVDADGDGLGELLFRETSDAGSGWVIYRATADTLWKMFDSLNPE